MHANLAHAQQSTTITTRAAFDEKLYTVDGNSSGQHLHTS